MSPEVAHHAQPSAGSTRSSDSPPRVREGGNERARDSAAVVAALEEVGSAAGKHEARQQDQCEPQQEAQPTFTMKALSKVQVPKSFYVRDLKYRSERKARTIEPKTQGILRVKKVEMVVFGSWSDLYCTIRDGCFQLYQLASETGKNYSGEPLYSLGLCGAHLTVDHHNSDSNNRFRIECGDKQMYHFAADNHDELLRWLRAFTGVPGLYRRAEDYFLPKKMIGRGATCRAYECTSRLTNEQFVLKVRVDSNDMESTKGMHNELRILQKCATHHHPAIPHLEDYFFEQDGKIAVVMEWFKGGELFDRIMGKNSFSERDAQHVFKQIVDGVAFLHSQGIAHRDLKPSNILIRKEEEPLDIAIVDYDLAKVNYNSNWEGRTPCGTGPYMAPEVVKHSKYTLAIDMWSLGCVLHMMLTGERAFDGKSDDETKQNIMAGRFSLSEAQRKALISRPAKDLMMKLLSSLPEDRPSAAECLEHPWLKAEPESLPTDPLPSSSELKRKMGTADVISLGSTDLKVSLRARDKLRKIVGAQAPPEGLRVSFDDQVSSSVVECDSERNTEIGSLRILLQETHAVQDAPASEAVTLSPNRA